jgi:hypothetical protein
LKFYTATKLDFVCLITDFIELSWVDSRIHCGVHIGSFRPYHKFCPREVNVVQI